MMMMMMMMMMKIIPRLSDPGGVTFPKKTTQSLPKKPPSHYPHMNTKFSVTTRVHFFVIIFVVDICQWDALPLHRMLLNGKWKPRRVRGCGSRTHREEA
jgi:hypothetical protein